MPQQEPVSRRDFLRTAAAAGAAVVAAPYVARGQSAGDDALRVAVIGCGEQGRTLVNAALKIEDLRFAAVCDIWDYNRQRVANLLRKFGHDVRDFVDASEMLAAARELDLDAVIVATPDNWHAPHTIAALDAGLHVYCEKLMCNTVEGARSMVEASRRAGRLLQIGHQRRSNPRYRAVKEKLLDGSRFLGRITNINGQWNRAVADPLGFPARFALQPDRLAKYGYSSMEAFRNWRWYRAYGGGPISDLGAHQIDVYNWFLGSNPATVLAAGGMDYYGSTGFEWYDNVMAVYDFPTAVGTVRAFYQVLTTTSAGGGYFEYFMGDEGALKMSENPRLTKAYKEARGPDWAPLSREGWLFPAASEAAGPAARPRVWEKPVPGRSGPVIVDARETAQLAAWDLGFDLDEPIHTPHLRNFCDAIRGRASLTCPGEAGFATCVTVLRVNEAVAAARSLPFAASDFTV